MSFKSGHRYISLTVQYEFDLLIVAFTYGNRHGIRLSSIRIRTRNKNHTYLSYMNKSHQGIIKRNYFIAA